MSWSRLGQVTYTSCPAAATENSCLPTRGLLNFHTKAASELSRSFQPTCPLMLCLKNLRDLQDLASRIACACHPESESHTSLAVTVMPREDCEPQQTRTVQHFQPTPRNINDVIAQAVVQHTTTSSTACTTKHGMFANSARLHG